MDMTTGLQGDIEHAASRTRPGSVQRENFCMWLPCLAMIGFGNDMSLIDDHCANHGVWIRLPFSTNRQEKGTFHVEMIRVDGGHRRLEEIGDFLRDAGFDGDFFFTDVCLVIFFLAIVFLAIVFFTIVFLAGDFFVTVFFLETGFVDLAAVTRFLLITFLEKRFPSSRSSTATAAWAAASRAIGTRYGEQLT